MWNLAFFTAKSPSASLIICLTPRKVVGAPATIHRGIEEQERIYTLEQMVSYLVKAYAAEDVIETAASEIESFKKLPNYASVKFAKALRHKALQCGDAFSEQRTRSIFMEYLPLNVREKIRMYWTPGPTMHYPRQA